MTIYIHRRTVYDRDGATCGFCKTHVEWEDLDLDHVVPRALGGRTTLANLRVAHKRCNRSNGRRLAMQIRAGTVKKVTGLIALSVPAELHAQLRDLALRNRRTMNGQAQILIERALADEPKEALPA